MTTATGAVAGHLQAITARDLAAYAATLHEDVAVILPNGTTLLGRAEVERFHAEFFADPGWSQHFTEVRATVGEYAATAMYEVDYRDTNPDGTPIHKRFLVTFVFVCTDSAWLLLHDQCTPLVTA